MRNGLFLPRSGGRTPETHFFNFIFASIFTSNVLKFVKFKLGVTFYFLRRSLSTTKHLTLAPMTNPPISTSVEPPFDYEGFQQRLLFEPTQASDMEEEHHPANVRQGSEGTLLGQSGLQNKVGPSDKVEKALRFYEDITVPRDTCQQQPLHSLQSDFVQLP